MAHGVGTSLLHTRQLSTSTIRPFMQTSSVLTQHTDPGIREERTMFPQPPRIDYIACKMIR